MKAGLRIIGAAALLAACGPLPHPFADHSANPLVDDRRVTAPVAVLAVPQVPGLAEKLAKALGDQDIAATAGDPADGAILVYGEVEDGMLVWRLIGADNKIMAESRQPLPRGGPTRADTARLAETAAPIVAHELRGDAGATPRSGIRVSLRRVKVPPGYDSDAFTRAMAQALAGQGVEVADAKAVAAIDGIVRVLPGAANENIVEVAWTVRGADGRTLGTVSQGSPVEHALLVDSFATLARQISDAAAPGLMEVIRKKLPGAGKASASP